MKAIKINIAGTSFLLPETHSDNYVFPDYIKEHKDSIIACVNAYKTWLKAPTSSMPSTPDMTKFKQMTGIIGAPFNTHDVELYVIDRGVDVVLELDV